MVRAVFSGTVERVGAMAAYGTYVMVSHGGFTTVYGNLSAIALQPMGARAGAASAVVSAFASGMGVLVASFAGAAFDGTVGPIYLAFGVAGLLGFIAARMAGRAS